VSKIRQNENGTKLKNEETNQQQPNRREENDLIIVSAP
jgi:hypothetical protein